MPSRNEEPPLAVEVEQTRDIHRLYEALVTMMQHPHAVLDVLLQADDPDSATTALRERFGFDEVQAQAVMDLQFRRATARDRREIEDRHREISEQLALLQRLSESSPE